MELLSYLLGFKKGKKSGGDTPTSIYNVEVDTTIPYTFNTGIKSLIKKIDLIDTSSMTSIRQMFSDCKYLSEIPLLNTSNVTNMNSTFQNCIRLTTIPLLDTSQVTDMFRMFNGCTGLIEIPLIDTSLVDNMQQMFASCENLTTIPELDISSVTNMGNMFSNCISLNDASLDNILKMCIGATSYSGTKTLSTIGFSSSNYSSSKIESLPSYQNFVDAGWSIGY